MTIPETLRAEELARLFHEAYERLAPVFGYKTRRESAVPWESVPESNRNLMVAVATEILSVVEVPLRAEIERPEATVDYWIGEAKGFETAADALLAENKRLRGQMDDVRAMRDKLWAERVAAIAMLRMECAEYGDNDWPDTLHLADVVEKHLADPAAEAVKEAGARAERLESEVAKLRQGLEFFRPYEDLILDMRAAESEAAVAPTRCPDCGHPWGRHTTGGMCAGWPDTPAGTDPCYCVRLPSSTSA